MREVISINGMFFDVFLDALHTACPTRLRPQQIIVANVLVSIVGQAGCQIANSCWEVSFNINSIGNSRNVLLSYEVFWRD